MNDYISREDVLNGRIWVQTSNGVEISHLQAVPVGYIANLSPAQPECIQNNAVHLCDSCQHTYVTCPSHGNDAVFGDGKGNDNICACNKYRPISARPEQPSEIQDILDYLDTALHPIISPEHWNVYSELHDMISMLSSALAELIRCKDCKYNGECSIQFVANADDKFFCGAGERRQDG